MFHTGFVLQAIVVISFHNLLVTFGCLGKSSSFMFQQHVCSFEAKKEDQQLLYLYRVFIIFFNVFRLSI